jgi:hypothetical protein
VSADHGARLGMHAGGATSRLALGERGRLVSRTEISRVADQVCRACGFPFVLIMAAVATRKRCYMCHAGVIEAVAEL